MSLKKKVLYSKTPQITGEWAVDQEFLRVETAIRELSNLTVTETTTLPPTKADPFEMRYADGTTWNPRGLGAGLYIYIDNEWKKISLT